MDDLKVKRNLSKKMLFNKREKPGLKCNAGLALVGFPSIGCDLAAVHIIGVSTRLELTVLARDDFKRVPVNRLEQINALKP